MKRLEATIGCHISNSSQQKKEKVKGFTFVCERKAQLQPQERLRLVSKGTHLFSCASHCICEDFA